MLCRWKGFTEDLYGRKNTSKATKLLKQFDPAVSYKRGIKFREMFIKHWSLQNAQKCFCSLLLSSSNRMAYGVALRTFFSSYGFPWGWRCVTSRNIFIGMGSGMQFGGAWEFHRNTYKLIWGSRICKNMSDKSLGSEVNISTAIAL